MTLSGDGLHTTDLTHSLTHTDSSLQWSGALTYGEGQRVYSQLSAMFPDNRISTSFDLHTPFTSDLSTSFDFQGQLLAHTRKLVSLGTGTISLQPFLDSSFLSIFRQGLNTFVSTV